MADELLGPQTDGKNKVLDEARERFKYAKDHPMEKKWRKTNEENLKYFTGEDQGWDEHGDRAVLNQEGRPALTMNHISPIFRLICGARPKIEAGYLPSGEGRNETAAILEACRDHVEDDNKFSYMEDDWFKMGALVNRSVIGIMPNYDKDVRGDIELTFEDGYNVYLDWDSVRKDRKDMQYMFLVPSMSKERATHLWPKKKKEIEELIGYCDAGRPTEARDTDPVDRYKDAQSEYYNIETKKFSPVYYWHKTYEKAIKIVDKATNTVHDSKMKTKAEAEQALEEMQAQDRYTVLERDFIRVRYMVFAHDIVFEEGVTPWERPDGQRTELSNNFPYIINEPDRIVFGLKQELIEIMASYKDPQKYHNKLASSILHIINSQAKGGYDYEKGAITPDNLKKLNESGSKPGANIEWEHLDKKAPRGTPQAPQAEMVMAERMSSALLDISGVESLVSTRSLGKSASGKAIDAKMAQGGNVISWLYRSFSFFQNQLADYLRDAIQCLYDYEKVVRIRGRKAKHVRINEPVYDEQGQIAKILNDVTQGRYDTHIREKEDMPTIRLERLKYFSEMIKSGALALPPEVLTKVIMELMDDPDLRDLIEEEMGAWMQQQASSAKAGPSIKEFVDIDKIYPLLARSEQVQVLPQLGIKPDMGAQVSGLPDANKVVDAKQRNAEAISSAMQKVHAANATNQPPAQAAAATGG